jgi:hypothetical protein
MPAKVADKVLSMASITYRMRGASRAGSSLPLCAFVSSVALQFALATALTAQQPSQQPAQPGTAPDASQQPAASTASQAPAQPEASTEPQQPAATPADTSSAAPQAPASASPEPASAAPEKEAQGPKQAGAVTEEELRHQLVGKSLYLRGGYLDNSLEFDEHGRLLSHSAQGSYTLSGIEVERVHLTKHKVELEGARYGLHFLGALPYEDPTKAVDRVKITPKKKFVKITIDRELVVTPKKKKEKNQAKNAKVGPGGLVIPAEPAEQPSESAAQPAESASQSAEPAAQPANAPAPQSADAAPSSEAAPDQADTDKAKAEMAAAAPEDGPADPKSVTTTTSPAHSAKVLNEALDRIFAAGLDERMMAAMPEFWKLYYQAAAAKTDYRPEGVLRQTTVDQQAKLLTTFVPESNDFAQDAGVAGMSLYHTVIGADGKPQEIAVARPIGFGLDENAVAAIRKANFQPAIKDGKPVPVLLDLVVQFHIYSKRTNVAGKPDDPSHPPTPILPGPYSLNHSSSQPKPEPEPVASGAAPQ